MEAILMRSTSNPLKLRYLEFSSSPRPSLRRNRSFSGKDFSKKISLRSEVNRASAIEFQTGKSENRREVGEYYEAMLKKNPSDPLLLRNFGKYLHEVAGDWARAEELYGRAILASDGGDGELFSMYGRLIWESQRDSERAQSYFDQSVSVSPNDCTVLGSYAQFTWEAEEDEAEWNLPFCPALVPAL